MRSLALLIALLVSCAYGFKLLSADFEHGGRIPADHTCDNADYGISPELHWVNAPRYTKTFTLVVYDETPLGLYTHWLVSGIPNKVGRIPLGANQRSGLQYTTQVSYVPLCPPSHEEHTYKFELYALDHMVALSEDVSVALQQLRAASIGVASLNAVYGSRKVNRNVFAGDGGDGDGDGWGGDSAGGGFRRKRSLEDVAEVKTVEAIESVETVAAVETVEAVATSLSVHFVEKRQAALPLVVNPTPSVVTVTTGTTSSFSFTFTGDARLHVFPLTPRSIPSGKQLKLTVLATINIGASSTADTFRICGNGAFGFDPAVPDSWKTLITSDFVAAASCWSIGSGQQGITFSSTFSQGQSIPQPFIFLWTQAAKKRDVESIAASENTLDVGYSFLGSPVTQTLINLPSAATCDDWTVMNFVFNDILSR